MAAPTAFWEADVERERIAEIAEGLNGEARAVLSRCAADERLMGGFYGLAYTEPPLAAPVGVNHPVFGSHYRLNEAGLAVRQYLQGDGKVSKTEPAGDAMDDAVLTAAIVGQLLESLRVAVGLAEMLAKRVGGGSPTRS